MVVGGGFWFMKKRINNRDWMPLTSTVFFVAGLLLLIINHERYKFPGILFLIAASLVLTGYSLSPRTPIKKKK
jgi:drug/metabolite transporter (DMT)-like permease